MTTLNDLKQRKRGISDLADLCGVTPATVWGWVQIPAHHVLTIARAEKIHPHELRPDIYEADMPWEVKR
jgi:DNA-binding transcriptional regulator YdaS (Cro superfamily)